MAKPKSRNAVAVGVVTLIILGLAYLVVHTLKPDLYLPLSGALCDAQSSATRITYEDLGETNCKVTFESSVCQDKTIFAPCNSSVYYGIEGDSVGIEFKSVTLGDYKGGLRSRCVTREIPNQEGEYEEIGPMFYEPINMSDWSWIMYMPLKAGFKCNDRSSSCFYEYVHYNTTNTPLRQLSNINPFGEPTSNWFCSDYPCFANRGGGQESYHSSCCGISEPRPDPGGVLLLDSNGIFQISMERSCSSLSAMKPEETSHNFAGHIQIINQTFLENEYKARRTIPDTLHYREFDCPIPQNPQRYMLLTEELNGNITPSMFKYMPNYFCGQLPVAIVNKYGTKVATSTQPYIELVNNGITRTPAGQSYIFSYVIPENRTICKVGQIKKLDGRCVNAIKMCVTRTDGSCDTSQPAIYGLDENKDGLLNANEGRCAEDENVPGQCSDKQSPFCMDTNKNHVCDADELMYLTLCLTDSTGKKCATSAPAPETIFIHVDCWSDPVKYACPTSYNCTPLAGEIGGAVCIRTDIISQYVDMNLTSFVHPISKCTSDTDCSKYNSTYNGKPLVCNMPAGVCIDVRYVDLTCLQDPSVCSPTEICTQSAAEGKGMCVSKSTIYGQCRADCRNNKEVCNYAMGEVCRYSDGTCIKSEYLNTHCGITGCACDDQTCVNQACTRGAVVDCKTNPCQSGYDCVPTNAWSSSYHCVPHFQVLNGTLTTMTTPTTTIAGGGTAVVEEKTPTWIIYSIAGAVIIIMILLYALFMTKRR